MLRSKNNLLQKVKGHFRLLEVTRKKSEKLLSKRYITSKDIEIIYKGLFIDLVGSFERYIENIFVGLISDNIRFASSKVIPKITFKSAKMCRQILAGDRSYVDWLPYDKHTLKRSKIYFKNGYPFSDLEKGERKLLEEASTIRNAIAHDSIYSKKKFKNEIISGHILLPKETTVIGYLRSVYSSNPPQVRYQYYMFEFASIAEALYHKLK